MRPGPSPKGLLMKRKVLSASAKIFLEKGYAGTSSKQVAELLEVSNGSPFFQYGNKEGVLLELVKQMSIGQFKLAADTLGDLNDPLLLCSVETALQMYIVELSEPLRELYVTAYTLPSTSQFIYESMAGKLQSFFQEFQPEAGAEEFFELEVASAGVMRNFLARPCDESFSMEHKLRRYLECVFRIYLVPPERYQPVIDQVVKLDLTEQARWIINEMVRDVDRRFEAAMTARPENRA